MGEKKLRYNEIYISPEDKEKIKNLYLSGSSTVKISSHICDSLINLGVVPNKSLILEFPEIKEDLLHHFIRGVFDGDGSVYQGKIKTQFTLTITSTDSFCNTLKCITEKFVGINCHIYDASNHNGITKVFTISGRNQVKKFMDWMYNDADLFLQRKYDRYLNYFYNINNSLSD